MPFVVLGYPEIRIEDLRWIEAFRNDHDLLYRDIVRAHFTLVFPTDGLSREDLISHVHECASETRPIEFVLRGALVVADHEIVAWHVFLVPDEGNSLLIKLHDRLYQEPLAAELRLEIPFIPHLGIASNAEPAVCKALAADLNHMDLAIRGQVRELAIGEYDGSRVEDLATVPFAE
jgi:hypothetical protein